MYEVLEVASGPGVGETLVAAVTEYADMPRDLRERLRRVSECTFATEKEAARYREERIGHLRRHD